MLTNLPTGKPDEPVILGPITAANNFGAIQDGAIWGAGPNMNLKDWNLDWSSLPAK
jgi:hypothetical protein